MQNLQENKYSLISLSFPKPFLLSESLVDPCSSLAMRCSSYLTEPDIKSPNLFIRLS